MEKTKQLYGSIKNSSNYANVADHRPQNQWWSWIVPTNLVEKQIGKHKHALVLL